MAGNHSTDPFDRLSVELLPSPQRAVANLDTAYRSLDALAHTWMGKTTTHDPGELIDISHTDAETNEQHIIFQRRTNMWYEINCDAFGAIKIDAIDRRLPAGAALERIVTATRICEESREMLVLGIARAAIISVPQ